MGRDFDIEITDIVIPDRCPIFKVPMIGKYSPSVDRINSALGYVKGNIQVISNRANILKNNATAEELYTIANYISSR